MVVAFYECFKLIDIIYDKYNFNEIPFLRHFTSLKELKKRREREDRLGILPMKHPLICH